MKRIQAYVSNQQILAAEMNSLAAASGGDSNNTISAIGTGLDVFPWIYNAAELAAATPVKVDSAMDYRDRIITVSYSIPTGSDQEPGGVNDYVFDYTPAFRIGYTGRGALDAGAAAPSAGNPPVPASTTSWALQIATNVWLYAHPSTGVLWIYNNTGVVLRHPVLIVTATGATGLRP